MAFIRNRLRAHVVRLLTLPAWRSLRRKVFERLQRLRGDGATIAYFHQADDPYSHLCAQLLGRITRACSDAGEVVLDPFGGSGTTLMAAQRTGRIGRAMEIAPEYVDVALIRFQQNFPGVPIVLAATGEPFEVVAQQRKAERRQESEHATV